MIKLKKRKRKNPILHSIGNIDYEIIDLPEYDESKLINNISKILERKFKVIINKLPIIIIRKMSDSLGEYDYNLNEISINTKIYTDWIKNYEYILLHEIGHFVYDKYLSSESKDYFYSYIRRNIKTINFEKLYNLYEKYGEEKLKIQFPLIYVLIHSLKYSNAFDQYNDLFELNIKSPFDKKFLNYIIKNYSSFQYRNNEKRRVFSKPSSSYMLDINEFSYDSEIFCEIFANYMIYDKKLLHNDNYVILKEMLPELRN